MQINEQSGRSVAEKFQVGGIERSDGSDRLG
jgi:hypothetical protein